MRDIPRSMRNTHNRGLSLKPCKNLNASIAQSVEHLRGKQEVAGSIPAGSSIE